MGREPCIQAAEEGGWNSVGARVRRNEILGIFLKNRLDLFTGWMLGEKVSTWKVGACWFPNGKGFGRETEGSVGHVQFEVPIGYSE